MKSSKTYTSRIEKTDSYDGRDHYIDFLRTFGILLLVVAHTWAPIWLSTIRTFDVPLMVFISAICFKPLRTGLLSYIWKRFKRIYIPVVVFLLTYLLFEIIFRSVIGKPQIEFKTICGSFLLLNYPSIGYLWIMRVFLIMAVLLPLYFKFVNKRSIIIICAIVILLIVIQQFLIIVIRSINDRLVQFILDEVILYAVGYSTIAILGVKIRELSHRELTILIIGFLFALLINIRVNNWCFNPQDHKYPPTSLYLLYGISCSVLLWWIKPYLSYITNYSIIRYISQNSMWIYLWHIIPISLIRPLASLPNMWLCRYTIVLTIALTINYLYHLIIKLFPEKVYNILK